jgi:hypothetical protein
MLNLGHISETGRQRSRELIVIQLKPVQFGKLTKLGGNKTCQLIMIQQAGSPGPPNKNNN